MNWLLALAALALSAAPARAQTTASPALSPAPEPTSWLASPAASPMPIATGPDFEVLPYLVQLIVVTAVVGALGYFALKFLRDRMPALGLGLNNSRQIRVVDKVTVDPKRMVFVVSVGERYWLLASTDEHVTPVAELSKDDIAAGPFAQLVENERKSGDTP